MNILWGWYDVKKFINLKNESGCGNGSVVAKNVEPCITYNVFYAPSLCGIIYPLYVVFYKNIECQ